MKEDYLDSSQNSIEKELKNYKQSTTWLFLILCIEAGIDLFYFILNKYIIPIVCPINDPNYIDKYTAIYKVSAISVLIISLIFYVLGAIKTKKPAFRAGIIVMGVLHLIIFVGYQFFNK